MERKIPTSEQVRRGVIKLILFFMILTPDLRIPGMPAVRFEQLAVFFLILLGMASLIVGKKIRIHISSYPVLLGFFSLFMVASIMIGNIQGIPVVFNDFFELYKILFYVGLFIVISSSVRSKEEQKEFLQTITFFIAVSGVFSITQYYNLGGFNDYYVPIIAPTQYIPLVAGYRYPRVVGLSSNPNTYGAMTAIGVILALYLLMKEGKKRNLLYAVMSFIGCMMTLSRAGFVMMGIGVFLIVLFHFKETIFNIGRFLSNKISFRDIKVLVVTGIIGGGFIYIFTNYLPEAFLWRLLEGANLATSRGWQVRLINWQENITYFLQSPVFGIGPAKAIDFQFAADNEWLLLLRQYGIIGTAYLAFVMVLPVFLLGRGGNRNHNQLYKGLLVGMGLFMIPAAVFHSFQLMGLFVTITALCFWKEKNFFVVNLYRERKEGGTS